jgi:hypothetical protein
MPGYNTAVASYAQRPTAARIARRQTFAAAVAAAVAVGVIALVTNGGAGPSAAGSATPQGAAATVHDFAQALQARDFNAICDDLFTAAARDAEGGSDCAATLGANSALLTNPRVHLRSVSIHGANATAVVYVREEHQPVMTEILQMSREDGQFKISGVVSPGE